MDKGVRGVRKYRGVEFVVVITYLKTIYGGLHEVLARHRTDKSD